MSKDKLLRNSLLVVLDLNNIETFESALENIDSVFLLTRYTADMLMQLKLLIDVVEDTKVSHIVHLGTYTSRKDPIPHFIWHDLYWSSFFVTLCSIIPTQIFFTLVLNNYCKTILLYGHYQLAPD